MGTHPAYDRGQEDVGNIVEFGHVNIRVPDQPRAILFYVVGMGLTRDPHRKVGVDNAWINVGSAQFHLPTGPAQVLRGTTGLVMRDLDALMRRLAKVGPALEGTRFSFARTQASVDVVCPWGNRIRVHAPDARRFGPMTLGMPYVEMDTAVGTAVPIARFYGEVLGARAQSGQDARGLHARIDAGPGTQLVFRETGQELPSYDGHHIQISLADFSRPYHGLVQRGLVTEESNQSQFRFQRVVDPQRGDELAVLEHEVRSMRHPTYARILVNRDPDSPA